MQRKENLASALGTPPPPPKKKKKKKKKIGGSHAFFSELQFREKTRYIALYFTDFKIIAV